MSEHNEQDIEQAASFVESKLVTRYEIKIELEAPLVNERMLALSIIMDINRYFANLENKGYKVLNIDVISMAVKAGKEFLLAAEHFGEPVETYEAVWKEEEKEDVD